MNDRRKERFEEMARKVINEAVVQIMKCDHQKVRQENRNYRNELRRQRRLKQLKVTEQKWKNERRELRTERGREEVKRQRRRPRWSRYKG